MKIKIYGAVFHALKCGVLPFFFLMLCSSGAEADPLRVWSKTYHNRGFAFARAIQQTNDDGYIVAGETSPPVGAGGRKAIWLLKLDAQGEVTWQRTYGGKNDEAAAVVQQTRNGGYIVAGETNSYGAGDLDAWLFKLDSTGSIIWQKAYGSKEVELAKAVQQTSDDGFVVAGKILSVKDGYKCWILKLRSDGAIEWQKVYGTIRDDMAQAIQQTRDGGFIVAGESTLFGSKHLLVMKLTSNGALEWSKLYGDERTNSSANSIKQTVDGGYIVAGNTESYVDGDADYWVLKLRNDGGIVWQKSFGGKGADTATAIEVFDNGYVIAGMSRSFSTELDAWIIRLRPDGNISWQIAYGGPHMDGIYDIHKTADRGLAFAGITEAFRPMEIDAWVVKLDEKGQIGFNPASKMNMRSTSIVPRSTNFAAKEPMLRNSTLSVKGGTAIITDTRAYVGSVIPKINTQAP